MAGMTPSLPADSPVPKPYPGRLHIMPWPDLPAVERTMERQLVDIVQKSNADQLYNAIDLTYHGLVIDIDLYRELLPIYRADVKGYYKGFTRGRRAHYKVSTNAPAKAAAEDRFRREAAHARRIIVMAGGPASGKSLALRGMIEHIDPSNTIVYENTLADPAAAEHMVIKAVNQGSQIAIIWVYMPFRTAVDGMIRRAFDDGRCVTLKNMVDLHLASRATFLHLIRQCSGMPLVRLRALGNFGDREAELPLADLPALFDEPSQRISHDIALEQFYQSSERYKTNHYTDRHMFEEHPAGLYDTRPERRAGEGDEHGEDQPPLT
jgi:hypothetical protein